MVATPPKITSHFCKTMPEHIFFILIKEQSKNINIVLKILEIKAFCFCFFKILVDNENFQIGVEQRKK